MVKRIVVGNSLSDFKDVDYKYEDETSDDLLQDEQEEQ